MPLFQSQAYCLEPHPSNVPAIEMQNASFSFEERSVLKDITFTLAQREFAVLLGDNGAGKTTLLRLILGLIAPQQGSVQVYGHDPRKQRSHLAFVPQKIDFNPAFPATVFEVVAAGLYSRLGATKRLRSEDKNSVLDTLRTVGLEERAKELIGSLSGGQQQRAFIARALVARPNLLVLDEPTSGIDSPTTETICCLLGRLHREQGMAILMVTHDLHSILTHAQRVLRLKNGSLLDYSPEEYLQAESLAHE